MILRNYDLHYESVAIVVFLTNFVEHHPRYDISVETIGLPARLLDKYSFKVKGYMCILSCSIQRYICVQRLTESSDCTRL